MAQRLKGDEFDGIALRAAARRRSKLVADRLEPGEILVTDPAVCLVERTVPTPSEAVEACVFATDRRLLFHALNAETCAAWRYCDITSHAVDRCTYRAFFRPFPLTTRLRARRRYFATFTFALANGNCFAAHGSRPFLEAIDAVLGGRDESMWASSNVSGGC
jgi:hypothetical protein